MWHVSSRSGMATLRTAIHLLLSYSQTAITPTTFSRDFVGGILLLEDTHFCACSNSRSGRNGANKIAHHWVERLPLIERHLMFFVRILYIAAAVAMNTTVRGVIRTWVLSHRSRTRQPRGHCDLAAIGLLDRRVGSPRTYAPL